MNKYATNSRGVHVFIWIVWFVILCVAMAPMSGERIPMSNGPVLGVVYHDRRKLGFLFPWQRGERVKKWALHRYQVMRARYREARLKLRAVTSMAQVVDLLTRSQLRYQLGALPVLYVLLESLQVCQSINCHYPTRGVLHIPPKRYIPGGISVTDSEAARVNSRKSIEEEHVG